MKHELMRRFILNNLDTIEDIVGKMAHEIDGLREKMEDYYAGKINPIYFNEYLNKFIDELRK